MKFALFIGTFFCVAIVAPAQDKVWSVGPEVGVNISKYGMDANQNDHLQGVMAGIFFTYSVVNTFALTTKILYSEKGAALWNRDEILKYIEVPITGRFFLNKQGRFRPNLILGPYMGFLRSVAHRNGNADPVKVRNYDTVFNSYDVGVTGGLGLNYLLIKETRLLMDARYSYGITDLVKAPGQINNETLSFSFGLSFGI